MPFTRSTFDDLPRHLGIYCKEVQIPTATVDVTTMDGARFCVLKTLDVTEATVTFLVYDEQAGIGAPQGAELSRHKTAVMIPLDAIRAVIFGPSRSKDTHAGFGGFEAKRA